MVVDEPSTHAVSPHRRRPGRTAPSFHVRVRVESEQRQLDQEIDLDKEWPTLAEAIRNNMAPLGFPPERIEAYLADLRRQLVRGSRSELVSLEPGAERFIRSHHRKLVRPNEQGIFEFRGVFPLPQFLLVGGGSISITVLLPRATRKFGVDLVEWTPNFGPQAFGKDPNLPQIGARYGVSWFWQNDPELAVSYTYPGWRPELAAERST